MKTKNIFMKRKIKIDKSEFDSIENYLKVNKQVFSKCITFTSRYTRFVDYLDSFEHARAEVAFVIFATKNIKICLLKEYDKPYEYFIDFVILFQPYEEEVKKLVYKIKDSYETRN